MQLIALLYFWEPAISREKKVLESTSSSLNDDFIINS